MKWVELHTIDFGLPVWVNMYWIAELREDHYGEDFKQTGTTLSYHDGIQIAVKETPQEIMAKI